MATTLLDEEIIALQSIYEAAFEELHDETPSSASQRQQRIVQYKDDFCAIKLSIPVDYPTCEENNVSVVDLSFYDNNRRISNENVVRQLEEIIAANTAAGKETLFDVCEYLRGKSYIEDNNNYIIVPEVPVVLFKDCPEEAAVDEHHPPTTVFQGLSAAENFAAACAAANAAAEKAAAERREATSKARENPMNFPQPGETSKAYYSRQGTSTIESRLL